MLVIIALKCLMAQAALTYKSHGTQRHAWGKRKTDCGGAFEAQSWNDLLYSRFSWDTVKRFRFTVIQTTCSHLMLSLWKNQNISFKNIWGRFAFQRYLWIYRQPDRMMLPEALAGICRVFFEKTLLILYFNKMYLKVFFFFLLLLLTTLKMNSYIWIRVTFLEKQWRENED